MFSLAISSHAHAQGVVVSSGKAGGYYDAVAQRMRVVIYSQLGLHVDLVNSEGSLENLARLDREADPVSMAFTQKDALHHYLSEHPDFSQDYVVLGELGTECVFLIAPKKGGIRSASDLHGKGDRTVAVGDARSGAAVTYEYLSQLDPRFRSSPAENRGIIESLLDLKAEERRSKVGAALVVQRPLAVSVPVEIVLDNPDLYRFVPIRRSDVQMSGGAGKEAGYSFEKIEVGFGRDYKQSFETVCTEGIALAAKSKLGEENLGAITKVLLESRGYIAPRRK